MEVYEGRFAGDNLLERGVDTVQENALSIVFNRALRSLHLAAPLNWLGLYQALEVAILLVLTCQISELLENSVPVDLRNKRVAFSGTSVI